MVDSSTTSPAAISRFGSPRAISQDLALTWSELAELGLIGKVRGRLLGHAEARELEPLRAAAGQAHFMVALERLLATDGLTAEGSQGRQPVAHLVLGALQTARGLLAKMLAAIDLDGAAVAAAKTVQEGRNDASGRSDSSSRVVAAAEARWRGSRGSSAAILGLTSPGVPSHRSVRVDRPHAPHRRLGRGPR